jgi:hypothetical protein
MKFVESALRDTFLKIFNARGAGLVAFNASHLKIV